jgi:L-amino acid N-acyltransferase YncA
MLAGDRRLPLQPSITANQLKMKIRPAIEKDFAEIWKIFRSVIAQGDTYSSDDSTTADEAYEKWMNKKAKTFVAEKDQKILGVYLIKPNQVGRGSHIGNCSYMVSEDARGQGIGKALALHSIETAKQLGYHAIQFNFVVSTNTAAVNLWKSVGFRIIATVPKAFNHKTLGYVEFFVMFKEL